MIAGVIIKKLITHTDERGFFREIIRVTDDFFTEGFGQFSVSQMKQGVIKAWHIHKKQVDWWYVHGGVLKVALYDTRKDSQTHKEIMELLMGNGQSAQVLRIPPGVAHGCKCISGPTDLFYITSKVYNPEDEFRIASDDSEISFDWFSS
ncbi:dTDP-4-dehydrorhamnose 3,5-epimerase family protein [Candidatus Omnitrophota bacterium]